MLPPTGSLTATGTPTAARPRAAEAKPPARIVTEELAERPAVVDLMAALRPASEGGSPAPGAGRRVSPRRVRPVAEELYEEAQRRVSTAGRDVQEDAEALEEVS